MKLRYCLQLLIWCLFKPYKATHFYVRVNAHGMSEIFAYREAKKFNKDECLSN